MTLHEGHLHIELSDKAREVANKGVKMVKEHYYEMKQLSTYLCLKCFGSTFLLNSAALLTMNVVPEALNEINSW